MTLATILDGPLSVLAVTEGWPWWARAVFAVLVLIAIVAVIKAVVSRI